MKAGQDCGIIIENFGDVKIGDILETYTVEEIKPVLEPGKRNNKKESKQRFTNIIKHNPQNRTKKRIKHISQKMTF